MNGLGDLVAKGLKMVGFEESAGCKCNERKTKLNEAFPFKKPSAQGQKQANPSKSGQSSRRGMF